MTGTEKIINQILQDSFARRDEIRAKAQEQAERTLADADAKAQQASAAALQAAREKAAFDVASAGSRSAVTEKRVLLQVKNEIIAEVIDAALAQLKALPAAEYFTILAKLAAQNAQPGQGVMRLSQRDLDRLPADFASQLQDIRIDPQPAAIDDGFILAYGDVEQNCTLRALLSARKDDIKDALYAHIFA